MATTKVHTAVANGLTMTAGAGDVNSTAVTMDTHYGASLSAKLTNGATGPTVAGQIQIQVSQDNSEWYDFGGALVGDTANSAVVSWGGIDIPIGVEFVRIVTGSNTGQNVTADVDVSSVSVIDA